MFLALRELRAARGRVTLMGGTVALITLLLIMLTGLTGGLSKENTSALDSLAALLPEGSGSCGAGAESGRCEREG